MKTIYLECKMGASGDMLMGALFELLPNREEFLTKMNSLGLPKIEVGCVPAVRCGITGSHMRVTIGGAEESAHGGEHEHPHGEHLHMPDSDHEHTHSGHAHMHGGNHEHRHGEHAYTCSGEHGHKHTHDDDHEHTHSDHVHEYVPSDHTHSDHTHEHSHFSYSDIQSLIESLPVSDMVKSDALSVYRLIGDAESSVHGVPITQIHFHEVGSLDAVADVVGVSVLVEMLGAETIISSPVCTGSGTVYCAHGELPVPAPATARLLLGIPCFSGNIESELCTPTGAALLRHFAGSFGGMPQMTVERIGYGMGTKDFSSANCVRAFFGETGEVFESQSNNTSRRSSTKDPDGAHHGGSDEIYELCCNLDDMTPEAVGYACELLLREGALDAFTVPIQMKKSRPGVLLCCLCKTQDRQKFTRLLLLHTTTLGVRARRCERCVLTSSHTATETEYGKVRVKISEGYGVRRVKPEYDDVKAAAERNGVPFEAVADAARRCPASLQAFKKT